MLVNFKIEAFWDMTSCQLLKLPAFRRSVVFLCSGTRRHSSWTGRAWRGKQHAFPKSCCTLCRDHSVTFREKWILINPIWGFPVSHFDEFVLSSTSSHPRRQSFWNDSRSGLLFIHVTLLQRVLGKPAFVPVVNQFSDLMTVFIQHGNWELSWHPCQSSPYSNTLFLLPSIHKSSKWSLWDFQVRFCMPFRILHASWIKKKKLVLFSSIWSPQSCALQKAPDESLHCVLFSVPISHLLGPKIIGRIS